MSRSSSGEIPEELGWLAVLLAVLTYITGLRLFTQHIAQKHDNNKHISDIEEDQDTDNTSNSDTKEEGNNDITSRQEHLLT